MKNIPYEYLYLGFALSVFADLHIFNWEFYAIIVPFVLLESFRNKYKKQ